MLEALSVPMLIRTSSSCSAYERIKRNKRKMNVDWHETSSRKIRYSLVSARGWKKTMQDTCLHEMNEDENDDIIWCIFDGHGGKDAAQYCKENWNRILTNHPLYRSNLEEALRQTFFQMDIELYQQAIEGGTTATCLILRKNILYIGYVGDSGAIAILRERDRRYGCTELTKDDKPDNRTEMERIIQAGLQITKKSENTPMYIRSYDGSQYLNMSRALGDFKFKNNAYEPENQGVTSIPHISSHEISDNLDIFLSSDGIWECMSPKEIACFLEQRLPRNNESNSISVVLDELVNNCISKEGCKGDKGKDNMTCFLIQICSNRTV